LEMNGNQAGKAAARPKYRWQAGHVCTRACTRSIGQGGINIPISRATLTEYATDC
jgi:hypothetical protein